MLRKIAKIEAETDHMIAVGEILKQMKPLGVKATIVLAPKGYNCVHLHSSFIRFNSKNRLPHGVLFIPKQEMDQVTVTHGAEVIEGDKTTFYYWNGVRLLEKLCTVETTALGLVFNDPNKAK